jgi:predicted nucleic acid-binding protein
MRKSNCNPGVKIFMDKIPPEDIFLSVISLGEIVFGIEKLPEGEKRAALSLWVYTELPKRFEDHIISIDTEVSVEWGRIRARAIKTLPPNDSFIAATALAYHLTLLTRNTRDFASMGGLSLLNPWD